MLKKLGSVIAFALFLVVMPMAFLFWMTLFLTVPVIEFVINKTDPDWKGEEDY